MMISKIDPALSIDKLKTMTESQFFDRKSARLAAKDFSHQLSAFANATGGLIVIGIEDDGTITGVTADRENAFRQAAFDNLQIAPAYQIEVIPCKLTSGGNGNIMLFHIAPSANEIIKLKSGDAYLRVGDSSRRLNAEMLAALEYSKGIKSYESRIVEDATIDDLDQELIQQYTKLLGTTASSSWDLLKGRGLIREKDGRYKITVAAILLFGKTPTQFLPGARVRFLRYEGITAEVGTRLNLVKDVTIELPLHLLLTEGRRLLESQMREFQQLGRDGVFKRIPEYPTFAWLEGLVNAVAHRDYSLQGDHIRIAMFDDRIEFSSPGRLPSIVTVDNIQTTRFSRNPMIARVLSDFGWVRELNEGVKRIYTDMESFFLDPPTFSEPNGNTVLLVLRNNIAARSMRRIESQMILFNGQWESLSSLDQDIIFYIANITKCTPKTLMELTQKTRPTIINHVKQLITKGMIAECSSSPSDPTKYYVLK
ncbi:MAG: putative DNA binding domain-containing protein [Oscillospiraceae bacterium]|nr:putative DNA binding domain-containing protein [Oscillospiraceae bacterium]